MIDTFPPNPDSIWDEIDLLEGYPPHRGADLRNQKFKPFWLAAEEDEWDGLWDKGVFKRWNKSDLLKNDRVFTSRHVYKLKRNAKTGAAYRFKTRLIVRGFEMVKGLDYEDTFSPTPGISIARLMVSIAAANDLELHSVDIEQIRRVQEPGYHKHGQPFLAENDGEKIAESLHSAASFHTATSLSPVNTPVGLHIDYAYAITMGYHKGQSEHCSFRWGSGIRQVAFLSSFLS